MTRPFPDMVKEAMFNLLRGHFEGESVLDCFSGTGTVGLEAASRGASRVVCIERDRRVTKVLEKNIEMLGAEEIVEVVAGDALGPAAIHRCPKPVHIVFFDPPYAMARDTEDWPRLKLQFERLVGLLDDTGYAVLRTPWPLFHVLEDEDQTPAGPAGSAGKRARHGRDKGHGRDAGPGGGRGTEMIDDEEVIEIDLDDPEAEAKIEAFEKDLARDASTPKAKTVDVDLAMRGAIGPETHAYGGMALHLYMRDPNARDA